MVPEPSPTVQFLMRPNAGWAFTLVPAAGEGGGSFRYARRRTPAYVARGEARPAYQRAFAAQKAVCAATQP